MVQNESITPRAQLRNRVQLQLDASVGDVWALIGDLARFPEYSAGLDRVEVTVGPDGRCTEYLCWFKPATDGEDPVVHREIMRWYSEGAGWGSVAEEPNAFGLSDSLTLVTVESREDGTRLTWDQYYEADDAPMMMSVFDDALTDIADRLIRRFGGRIQERYGGS
jgi:translation elongation factor EF-1beta